MLPGQRLEPTVHSAGAQAARPTPASACPSLAVRSRPKYRGRPVPLPCSQPQGSQLPSSVLGPSGSDSGPTLWPLPRGCHCSQGALVCLGPLGHPWHWPPNQVHPLLLQSLPWSRPSPTTIKIQTPEDLLPAHHAVPPGPSGPPPCSPAQAGAFVHAAPPPSTPFLLPHQTSAFTATCMSQRNGHRHQEAPVDAPGLDQEHLWAPPAPCLSHHSSLLSWARHARGRRLLLTPARAGRPRQAGPSGHAPRAFLWSRTLQRGN